MFTATPTRLAHDFQEAVVAGDGRRADWAVRQLLAHGVPPADIYEDVFVPALHLIGSLWQDGMLSVAEEHLASAIVERLMGQLRPLFNASGDPRAPRPVALVACVEGELHRIGAQMVADVFAQGGWEVLYLGADAPVDDLVRLACDRRPDVIALAVSMDMRVSAAARAIRLLRAQPECGDIPILVGGLPFTENPSLAQQIGADMTAATPAEALARAAARVGQKAPAAPRVWSRPAVQKVAVLEPRGVGRGSGGGVFAFLLDRSGCIQWANEGALSLAGGPWRVGAPFSGLVDTYSREKVGRLLQLVRAGQTVSDFELNHLVPGAERLVLVSYTAFLLPEGAVALVGRDPSATVEVVSRLATANQELEGVLTEMSEDRSRLEAVAATYADTSRRIEAELRSEREIALALQASFLGNVPDALPGVEVAYRYVSAEADAKVGGDFYDVIRLDEDRVALVIADVSGKGLRAAVATVMVKYALRAYAAEDADPAGVLERFNRFFCNHAEFDGFITVFYGVLNGRTGHLRWCSAGHEPILHVHGGAVTPLEGNSLVIGAFDDAPYRAHDAQVAPGDFLVGFTDGAVEAKQGDCQLGIDAVTEIIGRAASVEGATAESVAASLYNAVSDFCGGSLSDDLTLLAVQRIGETAEE